MEKSFAELTVAELYEILALRQRIFVVEQTCLYTDIDGLDDRCHHLWHRSSELGVDGAAGADVAGAAGPGAIDAYLRILPAGLAYAEPSLGRVIVAASARGTGLGRELMREGLTRAWAHHGRRPLRIGAQAYLLRFYESFGFRRASDDYVEDGIVHLEMLVEP